MRQHNLFVEHRILPLYDEGKILEIRVAFTRFRIVKIGDVLIFNGALKRTVKAIRRYPNFTVMRNQENPERILPGATMGQIVEVLKERYPPDREKKGVLVFELSP